MCHRGRFEGQFEKYKFGLGCNGIFIRTGRDLHVSSNHMPKIKVTLDILFAMRLSGPIIQIIIQAFSLAFLHAIDKIPKFIRMDCRNSWFEELPEEGSNRRGRDGDLFLEVAHL